MRPILHIGLLILLLPSLCHALPAYNLNQLIQMALESRPEKRIVEGQQMEAQNLIKIARSYYYPSLDMNINYMHLDEKPYAVLPQTTFNSTVDLRRLKQDYPIMAAFPDEVNLPLTIPLTKFDIGGQDLLTIRTELKQPLYTGGKISERVTQARHMLGIAASQEEKTNQEIIYQVKVLYFKHVFGTRALSALRSAENRLSVVAKFLQNLYENYVPKEGETGVTKSDYLKARVAYLRVREYSSAAEKIIEEAKKSLMLACGLENENFSISGDAEKFMPMLPSAELDALKNTALEKRPEVKQMDLSQSISSSEIKRAKAGYIPDIGLFGYYQHIEDNFPTADENVFAAGIGASIPIFNGLRTSSEIKKAKAANYKIKSQKELLNLKISLEVEELFAKIEDCQRRLAIDSQALTEARQRRQLESESYLLDPAKYDDYVESIEDEVEMEVSLLKTKGEYYIALASLQFACGL